MAGFRRRLSSGGGESSAPVNALRPSRNTQWVLTAIGATSLLSLWCAHRGVQVVRIGEVGIEEYWWGEMRPSVLSPGFHVLHPLSKVTKYSLQPRHRTYKWNNILGQNGIALEMDVTIVYKLDPDKIKELYAYTGTSSEERDWHLEAVAKSMLQSVVAKVNPRDLRRTHQDTVAKELQQQLKQFYQQAIIIELVVVKNIELPHHCVEGQKELDRLYYMANAEHQKALVKGAKARSVANYHAVARATAKRNDEKSMFSAGVNSQHNANEQPTNDAKDQQKKEPQLSASELNDKKLAGTANVNAEKEKATIPKKNGKPTKLTTATTVQDPSGAVGLTNKKEKKNIPASDIAVAVKETGKEAALPGESSRATVAKTTEKQP
jgi:prohibitin 1